MRVIMKYKIFNLIRDDDVNDDYSNIFDSVIILLIVVNLITVILDTFNLPAWYSIGSEYIEYISIAVFTLEYLSRLWVADISEKTLTPFKARVKYVFSFMAIVDLLAILPFYIPFIIPIDLRILRSLRMIRLLRLLKINRYTSGMKTIIIVFINKKTQLMSSFIIVFILMLISSVLMYNLEHPAQPDVFQNAFSGLWWAVATFTTVGYGDIFPITMGGRLMAGIIAVLGIGLVAIPTGIISAGFIELIDTNSIPQNRNHRKAYLKRRDRKPKYMK